MGTCESLSPISHALLIALRNPPAILTVPYPLPEHLLALPDSHFPPPPLDGDGPEQTGCELWDLNKGKEWIHLGKDTEPPVPKHIGVSKSTGTPALYTMTTDDGRVWGMHTPVRAEVSLTAFE